MKIFNSLGSNYSFSFATTALEQLFSADQINLQILKKRLEQMFGGSAVLVYKGRDAIEYALKAYGVTEGDQVLTQAFACFAIEEAIKRVGAEPVYVDIDEDTLNMSIDTLNIAWTRSKQVKAILIQHTLGTPAPITEIIAWAREKKILVIEDLAQAAGGVDEQNKLLGTHADAVILSFGRDKMIDGVTGGACLLKKKPESKPEVVGKVPPTQILKDLCYPLITWLIRHTHHWGVGSVLFQFAKRTGLLTSPLVSPTTAMAPLPSRYAPLVLQQLERLPQEIEHRRAISLIYDQGLSSLEHQLIESSERGANQRFWLRIPDADKVLHQLTSKGIFLTDRWYRQPVDCGSLSCQSSYQLGSCPVAEKLATEVINLPTHRFIDQTDAVFIISELLAILSSKKA